MISYLQIENLTKSFGDLVLLENVALGVAEGQRIGLIAKNGSGKTTLLNILAGKLFVCAHHSRHPVISQGFGRFVKILHRKQCFFI